MASHRLQYQIFVHEILPPRQHTLLIKKRYRFTCWKTRASNFSFTVNWNYSCVVTNEGHLECNYEYNKICEGHEYGSLEGTQCALGYTHCNFSLPRLALWIISPAHSLVFNSGFLQVPKATEKMCGRNVMYEMRHVISSTREKMFEAVGKEQPYFIRHKTLNF
jgi:hypothetical protein